MKSYIDFDTREDAYKFAEKYDGNVVKVINGSKEFYRVFYYED